MEREPLPQSAVLPPPFVTPCERGSSGQAGLWGEAGTPLPVGPEERGVGCCGRVTKCAGHAFRLGGVSPLHSHVEAKCERSASVSR